MRPMRKCKKPRLEASSDEEDEAEREKLKDLGQLLEEWKQLKEKMDKVEKMKIKVEEHTARVKAEELENSDFCPTN